MNSLKDEVLKQIKENFNNDFERTSKEIINDISFEDQLNYCIRKISQFKYLLYYYQKIIIQFKSKLYIEC